MPKSIEERAMNQRVAPTGEPHRDAIESEPWKLANWSHRLGIPKQQVRQLAAEVGPVFEEIKRTWEERQAARIGADFAKKAMREGR
jgi:hypothetical protein